jgi:hypothetical protein
MFVRLKFVFTICILLFFTTRLFSQSFSVSGFITSKETGEVIIGAYVFCPQTGSGSITNNYGYYALSIPYGTKNLMYMKDGYFAKIDTTAINKNKRINVALREMDEDDEQIDPFQNPTEEVQDEDIDENDTVERPVRITIKNNKDVNELIRYVLARNFKIVDRIENGFIEIPGFQISRMPSLAGEIDVVRAIKHLPGVQPGTELTNGLYVRGGGQDQNLVLLDGVPLYNMNHAFGFFSVFNSEAINSINLTKSGYSARNGGRLSAITDVVMKEGNSDGIHGIFLNSLIALTLELNGPLSRDGRTTFAVSGRRSHWDLLFMRPLNTDSNKFTYTFYDLNAKVCHRLNDKNKLFFSIYTGRDRMHTFNSTSEVQTTNTIRNEDDFEIKWGNFLGSFKWNKVINNRLFSNLTLSYSQYKSSIGLSFLSAFDSALTSSTSSVKIQYINFIRDFNSRIDYDYILNKSNTLKFGAALSMKGFMPGSTTTKYNNNGVISNDTVFGPSKAIQTQELAVYAEDEIKVSNNTKVSIGGRLVSYFYKTKSYLMPEPRISFNTRVNNEYALKGSYTLMNQSLHLLADNINSNILALSFDRWVPATDLARPQRAQQVTLGMSKPYQDNLELSIEGYYKWFSNLLEVKEGADINGSLFTSSEWESKVLSGKGTNYGLEAFLHKRRGQTTGWISYTLSWAKRNTPGVNRDETYYFQFDRRHYINIVAQTRLGERHTFSVNVVFSTGNVQSVPIGKYLDINGNVVYDYTAKNNYRLPNTFRIDMGINRIRRGYSGAETGYRFSIYNVLARNNPAYVYIDNSVNPPQAYQRGFLGFIPGITYYTKF